MLFQAHKPAPFVLSFALEEPYQIEDVFCHQATYLGRTVTGYSNRIIRTNDKTRRMKELFRWLIVRSCCLRHFFRDQAIANRKGDSLFLNCLLGLSTESTDAATMLIPSDSNSLYDDWKSANC